MATTKKTSKARTSKEAAPVTEVLDHVQAWLDHRDAAKRLFAGDSRPNQEARGLVDFVEMLFLPHDTGPAPISIAHAARLHWAYQAAHVPVAGVANAASIYAAVQVVRHYAALARDSRDEVGTIAFLMLFELEQCEPRFANMHNAGIPKPEVCTLLLNSVARGKQAGKKGKGLKGPEAVLAELATLCNAWGIKTVARRTDWITRNAAKIAE